MLKNEFIFLYIMELIIIPEDDVLALYNLIPRCFICGVSKTPLWRKGTRVDAQGQGVPTRLCNACGLRYVKYPCKCGGTYDPCCSRDECKICALCENYIFVKN